MLFSLPSQEIIDDVIYNEKVYVLKGTNLNVPKELPPPRGSPVKNSGVREKGSFEKGPAHKKR